VGSCKGILTIFSGEKKRRRENEHLGNVRITLFSQDWNTKKSKNRIGVLYLFLGVLPFSKCFLVNMLNQRFLHVSHVMTKRNQKNGSIS